jgi:hypothetical protein
MTLLARAKLEGPYREAAAARLASGARVAKRRDLSGVDAVLARDGAVVADPFHPTAALAELLRAHSRQPDLPAARQADTARPMIRRLDPIPGDTTGGKTR